MYPLLIEPECTEPYYTRTVWPIAECRGTQCHLTPRANWAHLYRALLHQDSVTYCRMQRYPVPLDPPLTNQAQLYRALLYKGQYDWLQHAEVPSANWLPIDPKCTEPYYTRTVWLFEECRHTQCQLTIPPLIEPTCTEPYYTRTVLPIDKGKGTQCGNNLSQVRNSKWWCHIGKTT